MHYVKITFTPNEFNGGRNAEWYIAFPEEQMAIEVAGNATNLLYPVLRVKPSESDKKHAVEFPTPERFYKSRIFTEQIKFCIACNAWTNHGLDGKCVICQRRKKFLRIWVKPHGTYRFDELKDEPIGATQRIPEWLDLTSKRNGYKTLITLIDTAKSGKLETDMRVLVSIGTMDKPEVREAIRNLKDWVDNVGEIRWYYNGTRDYIDTRKPPHYPQY